MSEHAKQSQRVEGEYSSYSFASLMNGAYVLLRQAENAGAGFFYFNLSAMILSAFACEAYLNHLGPNLFPLWDGDVKKGTSVESKLKLIASQLRLPEDEYKRLRDSLRQMSSFRNRVAHAETESNQFEAKVSKSGGFRSPSAKWMEECTPGRAKNFHSLAKDFIMTLCERSGGNRYEIFVVEEASVMYR